MNEITVGSLFDGIGGWPLAAVKCGAVPLWASEADFVMRNIVNAISKAP